MATRTGRVGLMKLRDRRTPGLVTIATSSVGKSHLSEYNVNPGAAG